MTLKIGIDVGGTFTDFVVTRDGAEPAIFKSLSTPSDPSIAVVNGLTDIAASMNPPMTLEAFAPTIDTIVHGTTVTTNATLTATGAKSALLTTEGVRDALEMRRGIREEQYNNRYTNVKPLVPRYLRLGFDTPLVLSRAELTLSQAPAELPLASQRVTFTAAEAAAGEPRPWELDLQGRVPVSRLRVHLPQTNTVVPLRLQQRDDPRRPWRTVASLVAWRLTRNGQELQAPAAAFEAASARYWQLVPDARSTGWSPATLEATLEWTAPQIVFAARGLGAPEAATATALRLAVGRDGVE